MIHNPHLFHIPVMGTGHSIDTPIRVSHLGIHSVVSVVDDMLCEKIRKYYSDLYGIDYKNIPKSAPDGRAKRITAYLDMVADIAAQKFDELKSMPLFRDTEKDRYFNLLPESHSLRKLYDKIMAISDQDERKRLIGKLTGNMLPGSVDVNIMAKVDLLASDKNGTPMSSEFSDANAALRGYANSKLSSSLVLSAGFNPRLYGYISEFRDFYRDSKGVIKKKIILKVSDFRSALIQGKFLAKKGLEVAEFRIESGLNCGGHAFVSDGSLLPVLLEEFREKKELLKKSFEPLIRSFYQSHGREIDEEQISDPRITVQGGIGNHGEMQRLLNEYDMDATGWGSPFLLVPEATCVDKDTASLLAGASEKDLYLSNVSPLGVPFNNVRGSGSERHTRDLVEKGKPGSNCPKGYLKSNTEFTTEPICTASSQYQLLKIDQIEKSDYSAEKKESLISGVLDKDCLCTNLGAGSMIRLGILKPEYGRQAICPGPNIAWFNREYSLDEMIGHIYGRRESLVSDERPHMFAKEIVMYVDYLSERSILADPDTPEWKSLMRMKNNLLKGMDLCLKVAAGTPYEGENLASIETTVHQQRKRLESVGEMGEMYRT